MKYQCTKVFIIGLIGIAIEALTGLLPLLAQQIPATSVEETSVISVENVKPLETPTGTPQDLGEIQEGDNKQWTWGVGGDQATSEISETQSVYQIDRKSQQNVPSADWLQENRNWESRNRGDYNPSSSKIPFAQF